MNCDAGGEAIAAVQSYIRYLQRMGITELPVTLAPPVRTAATALPAQGAARDAEPAVRLALLAAAVHDCRKCGLHRGRVRRQWMHPTKR